MTPDKGNPSLGNAPTLEPEALEGGSAADTPETTPPPSPPPHRLRRLERTLLGSVLQEVGQSPPFKLNGLLVMVLCSLFLMFLGFLSLSLPDSVALYDAYVNDTPLLHPRWILYGFQLPFALFMGALLGPRLGGVAVALYLVAGFVGFPVFAAGGGVDYLRQPGVGYLVGMLFGAWTTGCIASQAFARTHISGRSLKILWAALVGVGVVHLCGSMGLALQALGQVLPSAEVGLWWTRLTLEPLAYDVVAAMAMLCIVRLIRLGLWISIY